MTESWKDSKYPPYKVSSLKRVGRWSVRDGKKITFYVIKQSVENGHPIVNLYGSYPKYRKVKIKVSELTGEKDEIVTLTAERDELKLIVECGKRCVEAWRDENDAKLFFDMEELDELIKKGIQHD